MPHSHVSWFLACIALGLLATAHADTPPTLKVLQLNLWRECTNVNHARQYLAQCLADVNPDIILFSEINNRKRFETWFPQETQKKQLTYYLDDAKKHQPNTGKFTYVASKYPILTSGRIDRDGTYAVINVRGKTIIACSLHLNYLQYACYLPRGYHGNTWKKIMPVDKPQVVIDMNLASKRYVTVQKAIQRAEKLRQKNHVDLIIIGGDFNEPSHLDWTERTKNLYDHNGIVMKWHSTKTLEDAGFQDAYRLKHPDEVKCPAFTFPVNNTDVPVSKLTWAPKADERDRIDFIFYNKNARVRLTRAALVGPETTIARAKRDTHKQEGDYVPYNRNWPTDHAGNIAEFIFTGR